MRPTGLDIFIYLRKSRKDAEEERRAREKGEEIDVLKRHRRQLLEVAKKEKHNIIDILEEPIISGELIVDRPEIQRLLQLVEEGIADAVLVMDIDRLGRGDMYDMGTIYRAFKYSDTLFLTPTQVIDPDTEEAELMFGIKSVISREELKQINRRLQRGRRESALEGKWVSNRVPYGYFKDENLFLHPDPETAWVVKKIFQMVLEGHGRDTIAQELDGIVKPPLQGEHWSVSTITWIISNEVYLGRVIWGKYRNIKRKDGKYRRKKLPRERWIIVENAHEPLVDEETFNLANIMHSEKWRPPKKERNALSNPLAGVLNCELCGCAMRYVPTYQGRRYQIRCVRKSCKGKQKGAIFELVEQRVIQGLEEIASSFEVDPNMSEKKKKDSLISFKRKSLESKEKELTKLNQQKDNLHDLLESKVYDISTFMERQTVLVSKIKTVQGEVESLQAEINEEKEREKHKKEVVPKIKSMLEEYRSTDDVLRKNQLLKSVLHKATYLRKKEWEEIDRFVIQLYPRV